MMYGWITAAHQVGAGVAAYSGGVVYKVFGSYMWAFALAGAFCLLASLFVILIKNKRQRKLFSFSFYRNR